MWARVRCAPVVAGYPAVMTGVLEMDRSFTTQDEFISGFATLPRYCARLEAVGRCSFGFPNSHISGWLVLSKRLLNFLVPFVRRRAVVILLLAAFKSQMICALPEHVLGAFPLLSRSLANLYNQLCLF